MKDRTTVWSGKLHSNNYDSSNNNNDNNNNKKHQQVVDGAERSSKYEAQNFIRDQTMEIDDEIAQQI